MAVNFTPDLKPYSGQGKFRYWVQMVLPTIYDDSLSYMELLNKVVYIINLAIEDVNTVEENVTSLLEAFNELQQFTNDYFDNLDVQEEINSKLDEMAASGELSRILDPVIITSVTDWLNSHITPTSPPVDNTLTISGAAADSKTVGDRFRLDEGLYFRYYPDYINDAELSELGIDNIFNLPRNRAYHLVDVSTLGSMPPNATSPYNGVLTIVGGTMSQWPMFVFVDNMGNTYTGTGASATNIRWSGQLDYIIEKYFRYYPNDITDEKLTELGINNIFNLERNRAYHLRNVTTLQGMPTRATSPYNGVLTIIGGTMSQWPMFVFVDNWGATYIGTGASATNIRWDTRLENVIEKYFTYYPDYINNDKLSELGIDNIFNLPRNRAYHLVNVSTLGGMPPNATSPYNGVLTIVGGTMSQWPMFVFVDNMGNTYTGTGASATNMRWGVDGDYINKATSKLYNKNVVLVGDSIMYGSHMSDARPGTREVITIRGTTIYENLSSIVWTKSFENYLTDVYNCTVLNQSFPGCSFADVSTNLETLIPPQNDIAIFMLGVNDWSRPNTLSDTLDVIIRYCDKNNIIPIFITPSPSKEYIEEMASIRCTIKGKLRTVDFYSNFNQTLYVMGVDINTLYDDNVHYNDLAQPYFLNVVKNILEL